MNLVPYVGCSVTSAAYFPLLDDCDRSCTAKCCSLDFGGGRTVGNLASQVHGKHSGFHF